MATVRAADSRPRDSPELVEALEKAGRHTPKYLFRWWTPKSGGDASLNTIEKVTPHAFLNGSGHGSVLDMSRNELIDGTYRHLDNKVAGKPSEFSSWSQSALLALRLASQSPVDGYLAVLDAETFARQHGGRFSIFHVPRLGDMLKDEDPRRRSFRLGLVSIFPSFYQHRYDPWSNVGKLPMTDVPYTTQELASWLTIGESYGPVFRVGVSLAFFCCTRRPSMLAKLSLQEIDSIIAVIGGRRSIPEWSAEVLADGVFNEHIEDHKQALTLMRAPRERCQAQAPAVREVDTEPGEDRQSVQVNDELADAFSAINI